jgi:hypothetical protein
MQKLIKLDKVKTTLECVFEYALNIVNLCLIITN